MNNNGVLYNYATKWYYMLFRKYSSYITAILGISKETYGI